MSSKFVCYSSGGFVLPEIVNVSVGGMDFSTMGFPADPDA